jgi:predicted anti-sigma-YlaC factor YlaD
MECGIWREALSARLDGADLAAGHGLPSPAALDAHLDGCSACRDWYADAAALTRLARVGLAVPARGVPESVLDAAPGPGRARLAGCLRAALALLGGLQVLLGVAQLASPAAGAMTHAAMGGATPGHFAHEYAAWNLALGTAFLFVARRRTRPGGLLPLLTAFLAVLTVVSVGDALHGTVAAARLAGHALVLGGYAIIVALSRPALSFDAPPGARRDRRPRWRLDPADDVMAPPGGTTAPAGDGTAPAARRTA